MGLALSVGILSDLKESDPEGFEDFKEMFAGVNSLLAQHDLPEHSEPVSIDAWDAEMYGYSGLHYLRRFAAHIDRGAALPGPGGKESSQDPVLDAYFNEVTGSWVSSVKALFKRRKGFQRRFDHLILHSDAEGFYLPQDFQEVLFAPEELGVAGCMVGSAARLLRECDYLALQLGIPDRLHKDSDALWEAADSQGEGEADWQRYGIESFTCVALREACRKSLETGAAIVFC